MTSQYTEQKDLMKARASLTRFAWLSIGAAIATITLKTVAYYLTGSVGLLSDAIESLVNLAGAVMALIMLTIAARPADESHVYGHSKAEYFASLVEGVLILTAAIGIFSTALLDYYIQPSFKRWELVWASRWLRPSSILLWRAFCWMRARNGIPSHSKRMPII